MHGHGPVDASLASQTFPRMKVWLARLRGCMVMMVKVAFVIVMPLALHFKCRNVAFDL